MRLDEYLFRTYDIYKSRTKAQEAIKSGVVRVNGKCVKPSVEFEEGFDISITKKPYVSNGAYKMIKALDSFGLSVEGKVCLDAGASTGGFTQVLLERGAQKIYAVDVGKNQLDPILTADERVVVHDEVNVRFIRSQYFRFPIDFICADLSFISIKLAIEPLMDIMKDDGDMVILIKPQFESGPIFLNKNGIVKDKRVHLAIIYELCDFADLIGYSVVDVVKAPLREVKMNTEYLAHLVKGKGKMVDSQRVRFVVNE